MSETAIKFENISKQYRLGTIGTGTLSHDLKRWWTVSIRGKEDPYIKIGSNNNMRSCSYDEYVWALRDINLEVKQGEVLGIIGKNGAGKSTLLKLLSRVTAPTTGLIKTRGRIASLLEVGTGFHPEMTGRENVFMNGSIMGMSKAEIRRKFDEIVSFAGVEKYIDTPVKRYSSGMTVRLGFAIAAYLDPEILVVDEVLAVGDAEFQKKAVGKMQDVSMEEGRTVLFVSHNMASVKNLCKSGILLKNGTIYFAGETNNVISKYINENENLISENLYNEKKRKGNGKAKFSDFYVTNAEGKRISSILTGSEVVLNFKINSLEKCKADIGFSFFSSEGTMLSNLYSRFQHILLDLIEGDSIISCTIEKFPFSIDRIIIRGVINVDNELSDWPEAHLGILNIEIGDFYDTGSLSSSNAMFLFQGKWEVEK